MNLINNNTKIATLIVLALAEKGKLSKKEICSLTGCTPNYFDETIKKLVDASFVKSTMGKKGGYELIVDQKTMTVFDIFYLYQPSFDEKTCLVCNQGCTTEKAKECFFKRVVDEASRKFDESLHVLTIERLVQEKQLDIIMKHLHESEETK